MDSLGYDAEGVCELLTDCNIGELAKHEPDYEYPRRQAYIAVMRIELDGEPLPLYVKVALRLPEMTTGTLLSFHLWT